MRGWHLISRGSDRECVDNGKIMRGIETGIDIIEVGHHREAIVKVIQVVGKENETGTFQKDTVKDHIMDKGKHKETKIILEEDQDREVNNDTEETERFSKGEEEADREKCNKEEDKGKEGNGRDVEGKVQEREGKD